MAIFPGETLLFEFVVPFQEEQITKGKLTFTQDNKCVLAVDIASSNVSTQDEQTIVSVELSQAQSLKIKSDVLCYLQLNFLLANSTRAASTLMPVHVDKQTYPHVIL